MADPSNTDAAQLKAIADKLRAEAFAGIPRGEAVVKEMQLDAAYKKQFPESRGYFNELAIQILANPTTRAIYAGTDAERSAAMQSEGGKYASFIPGAITDLAKSIKPPQIGQDTQDLATKIAQLMVGVANTAKYEKPGRNTPECEQMVKDAQARIPGIVRELAEKTNSEMARAQGILREQLPGQMEEGRRHAEAMMTPSGKAKPRAEAAPAPALTREQVEAGHRKATQDYLTFRETHAQNPDGTVNIRALSANDRFKYQEITGTLQRYTKMKMDATPHSEQDCHTAQTNLANFINRHEASADGKLLVPKEEIQEYRRLNEHSDVCDVAGHPIQKFPDIKIAPKQQTVKK